MLKRFLIAAGLLSGLYNWAQETTGPAPRKLLIVVDAAKDERLRISFIQGCLEDLVYENDRRRSVYDSVFDSQTIYQSSFTESLIYDLNQSLGLDDTVKVNSAEKEKREEAYQDVLLRFDEVLYIKITREAPGSRTFYYDFSLFAIVPANEKAIPVLRHMQSEDCSIEPSDISCESTLRTTIRQVCIAANIAPRVRIVSNAIRVPQGLYMAVNDTLRLCLLVSDPDTEPERMRYEWGMVRIDSGYYPAFIDYSDTVQQIVLRTEGILVLTVKVNDRIADSKPDTITIHVINRPVIVDYFKGSFIRIGKRSGSNTHPFDDLYQPYVLSRQVDIVEFNRHYICTAGNRPVDIGLVFTDSLAPAAQHTNVSREFRVARVDSVFMIRHDAQIKKRGTFYYRVTLADHGIKARPLVIEQIYRKALPFYAILGFSIGHFKPAERKFDTYWATGIGLFLHPKLHLEYSIEVPLTDSVIGRGQIWKYPNHRTSLLTPLPFPFNKKGLLISFVSDILLFRYPSISKGLYAGMGLGVNIRMLYNPYPWIGTTIRFHYTFISDLTMHNVPKHVLSLGMGFIFLPIKK